MGSDDLDRNWNDGEKERVGKLIVHSPNEIEFEVKAMRIVHKVRLSGPKFEYSNKYGCQTNKLECQSR